MAGVLVLTKFTIKFICQGLNLQGLLLKYQK